MNYLIYYPPSHNLIMSSFTSYSLLSILSLDIMSMNCHALYICVISSILLPPSLPPTSLRPSLPWAKSNLREAQQKGIPQVFAMR